MSRNHFCDFLADPDSRSFSRFYTNIDRSRYLDQMLDTWGVQVRKMTFVPSFKNKDHHFTKTGSGHRYRNSSRNKKTRGVCVQEKKVVKVTSNRLRHGKKTHLVRRFILRNCSFCQDRLGTSIGKNSTKDAFSSAGSRVQRQTKVKKRANCITIDHFSAFEPGLVAPFLCAVG